MTLTSKLAVLMILAAAVAGAAEKAGTIAVSATVVPVLRVQAVSVALGLTTGTTPEIRGNWTYMHRESLPVSPVDAATAPNQTSTVPAIQHVQVTVASL